MFIRQLERSGIEVSAMGSAAGPLEDQSRALAGGPLSSEQLERVKAIAV